MAVHPFAIKCEAALEDLKRIRDAMRRAKASAGEVEDKAKKQPRPTKSTGTTIDLSAYGIGGGSSITPGGATKIYDLEPTPAMSRLLQLLANAQLDCQKRRAAGKVEGRFVNTSDGRKWIRGGTAPQKAIACPEVGKIQDRIMKLQRSGGAYRVKRNA